MKLEDIRIDETASNNSLDVTSRPCKIVAALNRKYPHAGRMADQLRAANVASGRENLPDYCFLSIDDWRNIASKERLAPVPWNEKNSVGERYENNITKFIERFDHILLAAAGTWDKTRVAVRFDSTMQRELGRTPIGGEMPCATLLHPRHWCHYFYTPQLQFFGRQVHGAFVFLDWDKTIQAMLWVFVLDMDGELPFYGAVELGPWPLREALMRVYNPKRYPSSFSEKIKFANEELMPVVEPLMSMYLYMCSKAPDIIGEGAERTGYPQPVKTKNGPRYFPPNNARTWDVGVRIGAAIRQAALRPKLSTIGADGDGHASPRAHVRCAHWHHYWVGPRKLADQKRELKWIHSVLVNVDDPDLLPMVIQPVKPANDE